MRHNLSRYHAPRRQLLDLHLVAFAGLSLAALAPLAALQHSSPATPFAPTLSLLAALAPLVGALALLAPGYALTAALFPRCALGFARRLMYSLGLSFAIIALGGLLLNFTPEGLTYSSWATLLGGVTLAASLVALWRGDGRQLPIVAPLLALALRARQGRLWPTAQAMRVGALLGVALALVCGAVAISVAGANQAQQAEQTATGASLWALATPQPSGATDLRLGLRNLSASDVRYRLTITLNGQVLRLWPSLDLAGGQTWDETLPVVTLTPAAGTPPTAGPARLTTTLALANTPTTTYRQVITWVTLPPAPLLTSSAMAPKPIASTTPIAPGQRGIPPSIHPAIRPGV